MKSFLSLIVALSILVLIVPACNSGQEVEIETNRNIPDGDARKILSQTQKDSLIQLHTDSLRLWEKFQKESEEKINDNDRNLAKLRLRVASLHQDMRDHYRKAVEGLGHRNEELRVRLAGFTYEKNESATMFKLTLDNDIHEVAKSLENLK